MDVLSPQNQFDFMTQTPEMQEFGFTAEMNELARQQAAAYQGIESFDLLGNLDYDTSDATAAEEHAQIFSAINAVNLSSETLSVEGLEAAVHAQRAAFAAERAAEDIKRLRNEEDDDDADEESGILAWAA